MILARGPGAGGEERGEGADGKKGTVEVEAHGLAPPDGIGGEGGTDLALNAGAKNEAVHLRPRAGDGGREGGEGRPVGDVDWGGAKGGGKARGELGLGAAGEAPDLVAGGEEVEGEGMADAGAGASDDVAHG